MATVYAFMNSKGGVGKTTLAANIGNEIAEIAKTDVLLVDTDPQCNLTQIFYASDKLGNIHPNQSIFATFRADGTRASDTYAAAVAHPGQIHDALSISSLDLSKQCASA